MDFSWTEEHLNFKNAVIEFAQKELNTGLIDRDRLGELSRENWKKCARMGIFGLATPEEYGGSGNDILTTMLVMEGLGYGCRDNGLVFAMNAQMWSVQHPILTFGTEAQKQKYLPALCSGELIGAHGMSNLIPVLMPTACMLKPTTRRELRSQRHQDVRNKCAGCRYGLGLCHGQPSKKIGGVTAFLVEKGTPGFRVSRNIEKMGLRTSPMGELILEDCVIPVENRLGPEGAGSNIFNSSMEWERSCILGSHIGAMERQLQDCVRYAAASARSLARRSASFSRLLTALLICKSGWKRLECSYIK